MQYNPGAQLDPSQMGGGGRGRGGTVAVGGGASILIIILAMLTALNRPMELKLHVKGALNNGASVEEIREVLMQATVYCGIPAGLDAFKVADQVIKEAGLSEAE